MRGDIKARYPEQVIFTTTRAVPAGTAQSINAGEPTKAVDAAAASPYLGTVAIMVDGDGTTAQRFTGISKSDSSDTVAAAGEVEIIMPLPGVIYEAKAKTSTTADTQAEIRALQGKRVVFDLTAGVWTVDAAAADAVANTVVITDGDFRSNSLFFVVSSSYLNFRISA
jgi:hypothetical protein